MFGVAFFLLTLCLLSTGTSGNSGDNVIDNLSQEDASDQPGLKLRRMLSGDPGTKIGRLPNRHPSTIQTLRDAIQSIDPKEWATMFTPPPLKEEDVTCFVEVQVTQRKPGRCIKLGGQIPACQSNEIVSVETDQCQ